MCFYSQLTKDALTIASRFRAKFSESQEFTPVTLYNAFEFPKTPVIADYDRDNIVFFNWGLIPSWSNDLSIRKYTLNARIEDVTVKKSFSGSVKNRCLVLADGFYEWKEMVVDGKKRKIKHLITLSDKSLFAFAGLYSLRKGINDLKDSRTYTILTTEANETVSKIAEKKRRMPVILKQEDEESWLSGTDHREFSFPYSRELVSLQLVRTERDFTLF
ncbi:MAG: SOS response-associated peptidase [Bacteroidales bacterium]|nr:SOS response-associated peptidase [Bacteroidales bacterium]MDD3988520.1 SOS response-associated peptidase [Bacteroidales bacterium]MDD4638207.1 SOS response-associated peptidase [Bacteroidales bacterium]